MSRLRETAHSQSPDPIPGRYSRNLPLRGDIGHGTKRASLPSQCRSDVRIPHVVETLPLIGIQAEQDIPLPVALPKRGDGSAGESAGQLARDARIRQSEAIGFLGAHIHARVPGIVVVIIAGVGCKWHPVENALYPVTERLQNGDVLTGDADFDGRFDLGPLL